MGMVLVVGILWMVLAFGVAVVIGRSIRGADERAATGTPERVPASAYAAIPLTAGH